MRIIAIALFSLSLVGCVQNAYERPYMISHEKADEKAQKSPESPPE